MVEYPRRLSPVAGTSFFLFGPRGTGKSTWIREQLRPAVTIDLLDSALYTRLLASPGDLASLLTVDGVVAIDEVQRIPALLHEVHRLIESQGRVFALTGSSARTLRRQGVNLLAGRALTYAMFPLTVGELGNDFDLEAALRFGQLPAVRSEPDPERYLSSYVETYLREEVMQEGLVRNLASFAGFLRAASFAHGAQLNVAEVARECGRDRRGVSGWFDLLEDLLLATRVPVFRKRAKRAVTTHPKLFFFDAGVFRALRPRGPLDRPQEIDGAALEGLVFQELRAVNALHELGYELFFWRTRGGSEVDFVLYGERGLIAIEVKHANTVRDADLRGLRAFSDEYPGTRLILASLAPRPERRGEVEVLPIADLLETLPELLAAGSALGLADARAPTEGT